ncbi:MAG: AAA family ATPase, partial [Thiohalorhabdaceae bacterium]
MLRHLSIRNLAVIAACDVELGDGFTVLTGETGAGKSILVDALGLVLGDRADLDQIRSGAEQA